MPLEAIVALPKSDHGGFVPATKARLNPGFSRSAWWVRLTLVNHDHVERPIVLALRDARVDRADFYTPRSGHWAQDAVFPPASTDANQAQPRYPVLNMTLHPGERIPVMVRVTSRKTLQLEPMAFAQEACMQGRFAPPCGTLGSLAACWR